MDFTARILTNFNDFGKDLTKTGLTVMI